MTAALLAAWQLFSPVDVDAMAALHRSRIERAQDAEMKRAAHRDLGLFWLRHGKPDAAEAELRLALPDATLIPFLAEAVFAQGKDAGPLFRECSGLPRCQARLAQMAEKRGDIPAAIQHYRAALKAEPSGVRKNDLALALKETGGFGEAERLLRAALAEQQKTLGPSHPETATTLNNLASLLSGLERHAEAEPLQRRALAILARTLGPRHVRTGLSASNLGDILSDRGRAAEAKTHFRQALAIFREALPQGHPWIREAEEAAR